jgi:hypothetical protein
MKNLSHLDGYHQVDSVAIYLCNKNLKSKLTGIFLMPNRIEHIEKILGVTKLCIVHHGWGNAKLRDVDA